MELISKSKTKQIEAKKLISKKTIVKVCSCILLTAILMSISMLFAFASGGGDGATTSLKNFLEILFTITKIVGAALALWGVIQFVMALIGHDPNQRLTAIFFFAGGLIVFFAREILQIIGVTNW